jgi:hypothetical protein
MASFLEKAKSAAGAASDTVMIKAHEATIMLKKQSIKTIQSEMGVKLYPVLMKVRAAEREKCQRARVRAWAPQLTGSRRPLHSTISSIPHRGSILSTSTPSSRRPRLRWPRSKRRSA